MTRFCTDYSAKFAYSAECDGQVWREAIAVLAKRSAELRLEAAHGDLCRVEVGHYDGEGRRAYDGLMERAEKLDELQHWLRDNPHLPREPDLRPIPYDVKDLNPA